MHSTHRSVHRKITKTMKITIFSTLALFAVCGLALADWGDDYTSYGKWGGYSGGIGGYGYGAGYGGGIGGGIGGGKAQYIPVPLVAGKGGSGFESLLFPLLFIFILFSLFNKQNTTPTTVAINGDDR